jgi:hypothetical protein
MPIINTRVIEIDLDEVERIRICDIPESECKDFNVYFKDWEKRRKSSSPDMWFTLWYDEIEDQRVYEQLAGVPIDEYLGTY